MIKICSIAFVSSFLLLSACGSDGSNGADGTPTKTQQDAANYPLQGLWTPQTLTCNGQNVTPINEESLRINSTMVIRAEVTETDGAHLCHNFRSYQRVYGSSNANAQAYAESSYLVLKSIRHTCQRISAGKLETPYIDEPVKIIPDETFNVSLQGLDNFNTLEIRSNYHPLCPKQAMVLTYKKTGD